MNRRDFLQTGAAGLMLSGLSSRVFAAPETKPYRVGLIGCGWYGKNDVLRSLQVAPVEVISVCDPDSRQLDGAVDIISRRQKSGAKPAGYADFRQMLKNHQFDLVFVGSPDHWHAMHTIAAIEAGAHVYCQKPTSTDVLEGEAMLAAARKHKKVVQVGTQRRSTPHLIEAKQRFVDSGALGTIGHVEVCCYYHMRANGNPPVEKVPDHLDYDLWTGPAPMRDYDGIPHIRWWRTFMEYGNGITGDMCVHMLDTVRWMMNIGWPTKITSSGGIYVQKEGKSNISDTQTATFEYDGFNVVWNHRTWGPPVDPQYPWSLTLYGEKGTLKASVFTYDFIPADGGPTIHGECFYEKEKYPEDATEPMMELNAAPATRRHVLDFIAAVESGGKPVADIEQGHASSASCILANVAMKLGRPVAYDPKTRTIPGDAEATKLLRRSYRSPWKHPADGLA
jgi:predicted dehydrogenase